MAGDALTAATTAAGDMTDDTAECIIVLVTVGSHAEADRIADALVAERRAACVNVVGPIRSVYRWNDQVHRDEELLLVIKTRAALFDAVAARIRALHSYETPEVVAVPITAGSAAYLQWLRGVTADAPD